LCIRQTATFESANHVRAGGDSCAHHLCFAGIHRQRHVAALQRLDDRQHPPQLLVDPDGLRAGARRFAADIEDVRSLLQQPKGVCYPGSGGGMVAAIGERVGRDVDDAHDERAGEREGEAAAVEHEC
jgi:hypothetical protein